MLRVCGELREMMKRMACLYWSSELKVGDGVDWLRLLDFSFKDSCYELSRVFYGGLNLIIEYKKFYLCPMEREMFERENHSNLLRYRRWDTLKYLIRTRQHYLSTSHAFHHFVQFGNECTDNGYLQIFGLLYHFYENYDPAYYLPSYCNLDFPEVFVGNPIVIDIIDSGRSSPKTTHLFGRIFNGYIEKCKISIKVFQYFIDIENCEAVSILWRRLKQDVKLFQSKISIWRGIVQIKESFLHNLTQQMKEELIKSDIIKNQLFTDNQ
eukprot:TRINITY_DN11594_c0_g1_i2.p1 TRINITY_DN11594_c0_g1~~TRINITY_DN11594_c0_g1_i2.p1  ORF type:complete len:302 (-),score=81.95 TRINITY_DN11594_c0_g1_i2:18-818(-)